MIVAGRSSSSESDLTAAWCSTMLSTRSARAHLPLPVTRRSCCCCSSSPSSSVKDVPHADMVDRLDHAAATYQQLQRQWSVKVKVAHTRLPSAGFRLPGLIPVLGSQPAGDVSHKPGGRVPLFSARPAVSIITLKRAVTSFAAW